MRGLNVISYQEIYIYISVLVTTATNIFILVTSATKKWLRLYTHCGTNFFFSSNFPMAWPRMVDLYTVFLSPLFNWPRFGCDTRPAEILSSSASELLSTKSSKDNLVATEAGEAIFFFCFIFVLMDILPPASPIK